MDYLLSEMPAADYYADPCPRPSLSQSTAHTLLYRSPLHAHRFHPKLGGQVRNSTVGMDLGTVVHALLLGGEDLDQAVVLPFANYRTKDAQAARDAAHATGKTPILTHEYAACKAAADAVRSQLKGFGVAFDGQRECVATWAETASDGSEVLCRGRLDHWRAPQVDDLKTCHSGHPKACLSHIFSHGYDVQAAAYLSAVEKLFPDLAGRCRFRFFFVEMEPPYPVTPIVPDGSVLALGRSKWRRAVDTWAECLRTNRWPGYATEPVTVSAPPWALSAELETSSPASSPAFPF